MDKSARTRDGPSTGTAYSQTPLEIEDHWVPVLEEGLLGLVPGDGTPAGSGCPHPDPGV